LPTSRAISRRSCSVATCSSAPGTLREKLFGAGARLGEDHPAALYRNLALTASDARTLARQPDQFRKERGTRKGARSPPLPARRAVYETRMRLDPVAPASRRGAIGIRVGAPGAAGDQGIQEPCNEHLTPISILVGLVPIVTKAIFLQGRRHCCDGPRRLRL
jgi:hypothetical protein